MPKKIDPLNKKQYGAVTAMLTVNDVKAAATFYQKALGFTRPIGPPASRAISFGSSPKRPCSPGKTRRVNQIPRSKQAGGVFGLTNTSVVGYYGGVGMAGLVHAMPIPFLILSFFRTIKKRTWEVLENSELLGIESKKRTWEVEQSAGTY